MEIVGNLVTHISVEKLFGSYTYEIESSITQSDTHRLFVLYGDNGCGKTTILQLLFHLLASEADNGHYAFIAKTRFHRFAATLWNGSTIAAERPNEETDGSFTLSITSDDVVIVAHDYIVSEDGKIITTEIPQDSTGKGFHSKMADLGLALYLLSDDRTMSTSSLKGERGSLRRQRLLSVEARRRQWEEPKGQSLDIVNLREALDRAESWIREQVFEGSAKGQENVNTIYTQISKVFIKPNHGNELIPDVLVQDLSTTISSLESRSRNLVKFGFAGQFDSAELSHALEVAPQRSKSLLYSILKPYIDGVKARLDALQAISDILDGLLDNFRLLLTDKVITYTLRSGFTITSLKSKTMLLPQMLSRGERQIILLLCNTLVARDQKTIFIIDEPEISLNIKWQRQLLDILLECTKGADVQFILATHSIEILSRYRSSISRLTDISDSEEE